MEQLKRKVRAVRRRLLWLRFLHLTLVGLFWLSILAALTLVAGRLVLPIDDETAWQSWTHLAVAGLLALCVPVGVLGALLGRLTLFHAAVEADGRLGLKERISSAILLRGARRPMEELLEADAVVAAQHIRPRRDFPFTPPRTLRWLPVPVFALVITALLLDQHNLLAGSQAPTPEERAELTLAREENQDEAQRLEELATLIEETASSSSSPEHFAELRRELEQIAENLREADASRLEEVADLSNLADQAAQQREAAERRLEQTSGFAADPSAQRTAGLQQAMQEGDFERAREMLQELAQEIQQEMASGEMTAEQLEQLADEIERMAEQMGENSETGQQLAQAAQAAAQKKLREIAQEALKRLSGVSPDEVFDKIWNRQLERHLECNWVACKGIAGESHGKWYERTRLALEARKRIRNFLEAEEPGMKDSLSGQRSALFTAPFSNPKKFWEAVQKQLDNKSILQAKGRERLDAIGLAKRFSMWPQEMDYFPSVSSVASALFLQRAKKVAPGPLAEFEHALDDLEKHKVIFPLPNFNKALAALPDWHHDGYYFYEERLRDKVIEY
ncbi:MAG: hypothetical protein HUU25_10195, partial [Candidatus Sumerlaeia bacterium]|nr:hypothetical protein [Candidatus Sumerlaeia bacterium]